MEKQQEGTVADGEPASSNPVNNKPNKWLAALLGVFAQPIAMLYVAQPTWAVIYLLAGWMVAVQLGWSVKHAPLAGLLVLLSIYPVCAIHAYRLAARYPVDKPRPRYSRWYGLVGALAGLFLVLGVSRMFLFEPFRASSGSMLPTLPPSTLFVVQKWGYGHYSAYGMRLFRGDAALDLHRADVVVFDYPGDPSVQYIMRVIGLPGDKLVYRDKRLSINGAEAVRRNDGTYHYGGHGMPIRQLARFEETLAGDSYPILIDEDRPPFYKDAVTPGALDKCVSDDRGLSCDVPAGHYFVMGDNRDDARDSRYWGFVPADHVVGKVAYVLQ